MSITFKVNGKEYTNYLRMSLKIQLDAMCNSFTLTASTTAGETFPFKLDQECEIFVNGVKKVTGRIEAFDGSYDKDSYNLTVMGRDKTADLLDSTLFRINAITGSTSLKKICQIVIAHIGADIDVVVAPGLVIEDFNIAEDIFAPAVGASAFSFLETLAVKRNVLLSSNADGNLLLTKNVPLPTAGRLQSIINDTANQNNIVAATFSYDNTERYNVCICSSQLNLSTLNFSGVTDLASVENQSGQALDNDIHKGRQYVFKASTASSSGQNGPRAQWEVNMRKARGTRYNVTVEGHTIATDSSELWDTNTLVQVLDNFAGINASMLVDAVTFITDLGEGNITQIELTNKDAYSLFIEPKPTSKDVIGEDIGVDPSLIQQVTAPILQDVFDNLGFGYKFDPNKVPE